MTTRCPDCKGSGEYKGFNIPPELCQRCEGMGELNATPRIRGSITQLEGMGRDDSSTSSTNRKARQVWRGMANAILNPNPDDPNIKRLKELIKVRIADGPKLNIGDTIYVYDAGWYMAEVNLIYNDARYNSGKLVKADHSCGTFRIPLNNICWNDTQKRWEHIRAGTIA